MLLLHSIYILHNILVVKALEEIDFLLYGSLLFWFKSIECYDFDRHNLAGLDVLAFVDATVCTLANNFNQIVVCYRLRLFVDSFA